MNAIQLETDRLRLILQTPEEVQAYIDGFDAAARTELSADWLAKLRAAPSADPWIHGFLARSRASGTLIGRCGFKGPPSADGVVEIAYGVETEHQGNGYATEAAQALVSYAFGSERVRVVRAHTLPNENASARVLAKCQFQLVGEVLDPEDGKVWRWERHRDTG